MERKDILINQPRSSYFVGGAEMVSLEHAKNMDAQGHNVTFATISPDSVDLPYSSQYKKLVNDKNNIKFVELAQQPQARSWYNIEPGENRDRWNIEAMYHNSALFEYIYSNNAEYDSMLSYYKFDALVIPRRKIARTALYLCGVPMRPNEFMSSFLAMYDTTIAITNEAKSYWQPYSQKKIPVVPTGVDTERFKPLQNDGEKIGIVFVGRLIERKGCDLFIDALNILEDEDLSKLDITIVGSGPQSEQLANQAKSLAERTAITFTGSIDNPEDVLGKSNICVLPSRRGEGLQGVLLEAMATGNKIIASPSHINSVILNNDRGIVVNPEDARSFANAIHDAIYSKRMEDAPQRARTYVESNFKWDVVTRQLLEEIS